MTSIDYTTEVRSDSTFSTFPDAAQVTVVLWREETKTVRDGRGREIETTIRQAVETWTHTPTPP